MKLLTLRPPALAVIAGLALALTAGAASADCGESHSHGISNATATTLPPDVVLHIETGPSYFSPEGPEVTVFEDGRVFLDFPDEAPRKIELKIPSDAVERLLDKAERAGALRDFDFGDADITDQATTTVEVRSGDRHQKHSIYALLFSGAGYSSGDNPLSEDQIEARAKLGTFVIDLYDRDTWARWETIEHPTGADDVVFSTRTEQNGWGAEYPDAVTVTIYGDGRVVTADGTTRQWSERRLQRFLREASRIGLLGDAVYGEALVTDQGTTTVEIHAGGIDRAVAIYALELPEGDRGLPKQQRQARQDLRRLLHSLPS